MTTTYLLSIEDTIKTSWEKIYGAKFIIWTAIFVITLIMLGCFCLYELITMFIPNSNHIMFATIQFIYFLLQMGVLYIGIKRAQDLPINYKLIFHPFNAHIVINLIIVGLLEGLLMLIPMLTNILILNLISTNYFINSVLFIFIFCLCFFLFARLSMSVALILDQNKPTLEAMKLSFRITKGNVIRLFVLIVFQSTFILVSMIPLGLGLIWSIPFSVVVYGTIYRTLSMTPR